MTRPRITADLLTDNTQVVGGFEVLGPVIEEADAVRLAKLIQFVENKARELNLNELLTLSTQAFTYFQSKAGFSEGTPDDLPPTRRDKYDQSGRKSKVLVKKLAKAA